MPPGNSRNCFQKRFARAFDRCGQMRRSRQHEVNLANAGDASFHLDLEHVAITRHHLVKHRTHNAAQK
jgi:hypothetical protein